MSTIKKEIWHGFLLSFTLYFILGCVLIVISYFFQSTIVQIIGSSIGGTLLTISLLNLVIEYKNKIELIEKYSIFGDYFQHGFKKIYTSRKDPDFIIDIEKYRNNIKGEVKILSLIGSEFTGNREKAVTSINLVNSSNKTTFLFIHPNSHGHNYRYSELEPVRDDYEVLGKERERLFERFKVFIKILCDPERNISNKIEIKFYRTLPVFGLEFYGNILFVTFYGYRTRGLNSPIFVFERKENSTVFNYFEKQWRNYYEDSVELE